MKTYQCHKRVQAARITAVQYVQPKVASAYDPMRERGFFEITLDDGSQIQNSDQQFAKAQPGGYLVIYENGYKSYFPKEEFEDFYTEVTNGSMTFGAAIEAMKAGERVARAGWNGAGQWIALGNGNDFLAASQFWNEHARAHAEQNGGGAPVRPYFILKTAQNDILMGWSPSQSDALANDWLILEAADQPKQLAPGVSQVAESSALPSIRVHKSTAVGMTMMPSIDKHLTALCQSPQHQYRKKPVVIEAFQFQRRNIGPKPRPEWFENAVTCNEVILQNTGKYHVPTMPAYCEIKTLEGVMRADEGDWIIRGVKGELYPCKPDIFAATYEAVHESADIALSTSPQYVFKPRDPDLTDQQQGVYNKFIVRRVDGSDEPGGKHHGCAYFVLDLTHDQNAKAAMRAYAAACVTTYPVLAQEITDQFGQQELPPAPGAAHPGYSTMQPHQQRVVDEKTELDDKLKKLSSFIGTTIFVGLNGAEQNRLKHQAVIMATYSDILAERIAAF